MKTVLIVDGYNAINAIAELRKKLKESLLSARSEIIIITKEYARSSGYITDFHVVFDGQDKYRYMDGLRVPQNAKHTFSRTGDGDEKIISTINNIFSCLSFFLINTLNNKIIVLFVDQSCWSV